MSYVPSQPSLPSQSHKMLEDLVDYYRQMVEYHEQAATVAREQLSHAKALLNTNALALPENNSNKFLPPGNRNHNQQEKYYLTTPLPELPADFSTETELEESALALKQQLDYQEQRITEAIDRLLETHRGTILHVDYLIRELFGELDKDDIASKTSLVKSILLKGESQGLWHSVPDSPGCYTFSLQDLPDLLATNKPQRKPAKNKARRPSPLPKLEQLKYMTLYELVASVLREHYPQIMSAADVLDVLYPNGLDPKKKNVARKSISNTLTKGCESKGWKRVQPGRYIWAGGFT
ncbi:hypothetical protein BJP36_06820 [Moorena producens JHB]|uniref:Uncharacterized protein n=1 Tax=Moorena producens (strain JHB) TaxID=1454205 RepID=A0A1D9FWD2_MOOP1|nr:hypothetical protein [Moorena producens]AOY79679.2 hypothetical protein BJP36_06820 [Moorena producens JHB]